MTETQSDHIAWYVIRTRAQHENVVRDQIASRGIEVFLPLVDRMRQWKDRKKLISFPLFPGYCFVRFSPEDRLSVLTAPGVVEILGNSQGPLPVPDDEVEGVRRLVTSTLKHDPHPYLKEGMAVEVKRGALTGLRGIMVRKGAKARFVISVNLIGQAVSVELDADDLAPIKPKEPPAPQ